VIISLWLISLYNLLSWEFTFNNPLVYVFVWIQMHLYTGLFITAHDAMHRTISPDHLKLNNVIGQVCTALYAAFSFKKLNTKHHEHHRFVHTDKDPDYHSGNFFAWYYHFILQYISWRQILTMAVIYNVLKIWVAESNLLIFWVVPSLLSTLQLFYFGTYLPHKGEHDNVYQSSTQSKNHWFAFFSCYFFGYHYEHHDSPATPWWKLWQLKN